MKSLRTFLSWAFVAAVALTMGSLSVSLMSPPARAASYFSGGTGNVSGPASSTDNAIVRWDGTTGRTIQNSAATIDDSGNLSAVAATFSASVTTSGAINAGSGTISGGGSLLVTDSNGHGVRWYPMSTNGQMKIVDQNATTGVTLDVVTYNTLTVMNQAGSSVGNLAVAGIDMNGYLYSHNTTDLRMGSSSYGATLISKDTTGTTLVGRADLATNATVGHLYIPSVAGTPTGVPTAVTGMAPIVIDRTNNKLYFYSGGAWRDAGP